MNKIGHLISGFALSIIFIILMHEFYLWYDFNFLNMFYAVLIISAYSLLPDIDCKSGTITWSFLGLSIAMLIYGAFFDNIILMFGIVLAAATFFCADRLPHRGIIHSIPTGLLVSLILLLKLNYQFAVLGFVAFFSHLLADGIPFKFK